MKSFFTEIYDKLLWGIEGSGGGSTIKNTVVYRRYLQRFLKIKHIKTIIDYGCGDWQSTQLINFDGIEYLGIDCVDSVIEKNIINYEQDNITFLVLDEMKDFFSYTADLLILKDVLQHWTIDEINYFLTNVKDNFKFILITNSSHQTVDNEEYNNRSRPLSANFEPLKTYNCKIVLKYMADNQKETSLIEK